MSPVRNNRACLIVEELEPRLALSRFSHFVHHVEHSVNNAVSHITQPVRQVTSHVINEIKRDVQKVEREMQNGVDRLAGEIKEAAKNGLQELKQLLTHPWGLRIRQTGDNYDEVRRGYQERYGANNVYFSGHNFTDWAGAEVGSVHLAAAILSSGASLPVTAADVKLHLQVEATHIAAWLAGKVKADGVAMAQSILGSLAEGHDVATPYFAVKWTHVNYTYRVQWPGGSHSFTIPHLAFAVIWKTSPVATPNPTGPAQAGTAITTHKTPPVFRTAGISHTAVVDAIFSASPRRLSRPFSTRR